MELLDDYVAAKRRIARHYREALRRRPRHAQPRRRRKWAHGTCWLHTILVDAGHYGRDSREKLLRLLTAQQIQTRPLWQPMHRSPSLADCPRTPCPVADRLHRDALSLPCSVGLDAASQNRVIAAVESAARTAIRRGA